MDPKIKPGTDARTGSESLMTLKEVAEVSRLSRVSLWKATRRGDLKIVRFGRAVRVRPQDLREFIERHVTGGAA